MQSLPFRLYFCGWIKPNRMLLSRWYLLGSCFWFYPCFLYAVPFEFYLSRWLS